MRNPTRADGHFARRGRAVLAGAALLAGSTLLQEAGSLSAQGRATGADETRGDARAAVTIECALPARVDRLGSQLTMLGARQVVQIAPEECRERGGEVVSDGSQVETPAAESTD